MYNLSTDYELLYKYLLQGHRPICFVNYNFMGQNPVCRDVCRLRRDTEFRIYFMSRGIEYGGVYPSETDYGSEKEMFIQECKALNVEWINPEPPRMDAKVLSHKSQSGKEGEIRIEISESNYEKFEDVNPDLIQIIIE